MLNPRPRELLLLWVVAVIELSGSGPLLRLAAPAKTGCRSSCGNLKIPYPFGTKDGGNDCYYDSGGSDLFVIFCDRSLEHPVPYLVSNESNIQVDYISVDNHELHIKMFTAYDCYSSSGERRRWSSPMLSLPTFLPLSSTKNRLTVVGCDTYAFFTGQQDKMFSTGCMSTCNSIDDVTNGSCLGIGCCQTVFPRNMRAVNISLGSYHNHTHIHDFNPCSFAFIAMNDYFNFSTASLENITEDKMPLILDWAIGDQMCEGGQKNMTSYMCKENTDCVDADAGEGYRCHCKKGYSGNPYLSGPDGCQDINECENSKSCNGICTNLPGSYKCSCPVGYGGDPWKDGCSPIEKEKKYKSRYIALVIVGVVAALLFLLSARWLCKRIKRRKKMTLRQKFFKQNGGLLLQQQLACPEGNIEKSKFFSSKELERATDNFNENRILGQGGQGTVYKGMLTNGRIVAIKKSKMLYKGDVEPFINEVSILSRINHRNVVNLLGCCLETEVPLLVYEFIPNGTLYQYLHEPNEEFQVPWDVRLRIASEVAGALFYLHSATSIPIYHRDIKTTNILLDEKYRAKIADFGTSRLVALDQTHVTTVVQGTFGYLDPEYFQSSQFTDKSDVYSFGVVLVELLTGQKPISSPRGQERIGLATYFILSVEEDRLFKILDARILNAVNREEIIAVANLARRCLYLNGRMRPTMKEVAMALESVRKSSHPSNMQGIEEMCWNFEIDGIKAHDVSFRSTGFEAGVPVSLTTDVYPLLPSDT